MRSPDNSGSDSCSGVASHVGTTATGVAGTGVDWASAPVGSGAEISGCSAETGGGFSLVPVCAQQTGSLLDRARLKAT